MYARKNSGKKLILLLVAVMLILGCAIGGTIAWLLTQTESIVNTFTAGNINITLTEPSFKSNTSDGRYKAIPGDVIAKDPTVTVASGSERCYVRVFVVNWWREETDGHFSGTEAAGWYNYSSFVPSTWTQAGLNYVDTSSGVKGHLTEFRYNTVVDASDGEQTISGPFSQITVPAWITGEKYASLDNYKIVLIAQAVQADGFANADAAFEAAGLPTNNLGLGDGAPATMADLIALHKPQTPGDENTNN